MAESIKLNLICAMCKNRGIGYKNQLPWRFKKEMAYFSQITSRTKDPEKMNAVIMGRKTFESIPKKFFPLPKRINIVLSRTMKEAPEGSYLAQNLKEAVDLTSVDHLKEKIEKLFIIGGYTAYEEAIESDYPCRIYLTKIQADFECDTFFPEFTEEEFPELIGLADVPSEEQEEKGIKWTYHVYERRKGPWMT